VDRSIPAPVLPKKFEEEIVDLMKVVETKYHTFAKDITDEGFRQSRDHRYIAGWSMGSVTTWSIFSRHIAYFRKFGNMSCDSWIVEQDGGKNCPNETAEALIEAIRKQGFDRHDYENYIITGSKDGTYNQVILMQGCLIGYPDYFLFSGEGQNASFLIWKDGEHHTPWRLQYTYNVIKNFLK
jgi:hypothetical protein